MAKPGDVFIDFPKSQRGRSPPAVAFSGDHPDQLTTSNQQGFDALLFQMAGLRLASDSVGEEGQNLRIKLLRFRQFAGATSESHAPDAD